MCDAIESASRSNLESPCSSSELYSAVSASARASAVTASARASASVDLRSHDIQDCQGFRASGIIDASANGDGIDLALQRESLSWRVSNVS
jgi:hypothetical protein